MQVNPQHSVRPVLSRRRVGDKLDSENLTPNFENQVQDSNSNLRRKKEEDSGKQKDGKPEQKKRSTGSIDIKA